MDVDLSPSLLESVGTVTVPATTRSFVVNERFVLGSDPKIIWVRDRFKEWFAGKIEEPMEETEIRCSRLAKPSADGSILVELGENAETTLAQIWQLLKLRPNGQERVLFTNQWANIFYVRDADGVLRVVSFRWHLGWRVSASSAESSLEWHGAARVFSRSS